MYLMIIIAIILSSIMAEAALFVYKPKEFKALPYVVLAVMMLLYFIGPFFHYGVGSGPDHLFVSGWIPRIVFFNREFILITALPVVALLVLMIVKKSQEKKENETAS